MNDKLESYIQQNYRITQESSEIKTLSDEQKLKEHDKSRLLLNKNNKGYSSNKENGHKWKAGDAGGD